MGIDSVAERQDNLPGRLDAIETRRAVTPARSSSSTCSALHPQRVRQDAALPPLPQPAARLLSNVLVGQSLAMAPVDEGGHYPSPIHPGDTEHPMCRL